jgi:hypothetical protein
MVDGLLSQSNVERTIWACMTFGPRLGETAQPPETMLTKYLRLVHQRLFVRHHHLILTLLGFQNRDGTYQYALHTKSAMFTLELIPGSRPKCYSSALRTTRSRFLIIGLCVAINAAALVSFSTPKSI